MEQIQNEQLLNKETQTSKQTRFVQWKLKKEKIRLKNGQQKMLKKKVGVEKISVSKNM